MSDDDAVALTVGASSPDARFALARRILIAGGALVVLLGAIVLALTQDVPAIVGVAAWILGAIIVHDAIISPVVLGIGILLRRTGQRTPPALLAFVQGAIIVGSILTLVVVPEIYAATLGRSNPTILPLDYGLHLAVMWGVIVVVTVGVCALVLGRGRRSKAAARR